MEIVSGSETSNEKLLGDFSSVHEEDLGLSRDFPHPFRSPDISNLRITRYTIHLYLENVNTSKSAETDQMRSAVIKPRFNPLRYASYAGRLCSRDTWP